MNGDVGEEGLNSGESSVRLAPAGCSHTSCSGDQARFPQRRGHVLLGHLVDERGFGLDQECILIEGIPVQFLEAFDPLTTEGVEQAVELPVGGVRARVLRIEHLMAIMLQVGRPKDHVRLALALEQAAWDRDRFRDVLKRHGLAAKWTAFRRRFGDG